jgi:hypothetical protein
VVIPLIRKDIYILNRFRESRQGLPAQWLLSQSLFTILSFALFRLKFKIIYVLLFYSYFINWSCFGIGSRVGWYCLNKKGNFSWSASRANNDALLIWTRRNVCSLSRIPQYTLLTNQELYKVMKELKIWS